MAITSTTNLAYYVEEELGHTVHPSSDRDRIVDLLDRCHKMVKAGGGELNLDKNGNMCPTPIIFPWALALNPIVLNTSPIYNTGTCAATLGSNSVTLSTVTTTNIANYHVQIGTDDEIYRIKTHTVGTGTITLDANYVGTNSTAAEYKAFKLLYSFEPGGSDTILMPVSPIRIYDANSEDYTVDIIDMQELHKQFPLSEIEEGMPEKAGLRFQGATNVMVQMSHYTENAERMEMDYIDVPSTLVDNRTTEVDPVIPDRHRLVLAHWAAYIMLRTNDDSRSKEHLLQALSIFQSLKQECNQLLQRQDETLGYLAPRPGQFGRLGRKIGGPVDSH